MTKNYTCMQIKSHNIKVAKNLQKGNKTQVAPSKNKYEINFSTDYIYIYTIDRITYTFLNS